MAQVTIYLEDALAEKARQHAMRAERSLSAWIAELVRRETVASEWPQGFVHLLTHGRCELVEPDDPPADDIEVLP